MQNKDADGKFYFSNKPILMPAFFTKLQLLFVSIGFLIVFGCNVGKSAYCNGYEKKYMLNSNRYKDVSIFHDVKAIKKQTNEGVYTVTIHYVSSSGWICKFDTLEVIRRAVSEAGYLLKGLNYKKYYRYIDVIFESNDDRDVNDQSLLKARGVISCYYQIRMPVANIDDARIIRSNNDFSGVDFKRSSW